MASRGSPPRSPPPRSKRLPPPDRPMASALEGTGGVRALVVGGCCELNTTAHELLVDIGRENIFAIAVDPLRQNGHRPPLAANKGKKFSARFVPWGRGNTSRESAAGPLLATSRL